MSTTNNKKPFYKRGWFLTVAVLLCLYMVGSSENYSNKIDDVPFVIKRAENSSYEDIDNTENEANNDNIDSTTSENSNVTTVEDSNRDTNKDSTKVATDDTATVSENINYGTTTKGPADIEEIIVIPYKPESIKTNDAAKKTPEPAIDSTPIYSYDEENSVYIGETGNKYHFKNCRTLKGNGIPISLEEAKAQGRSACKICH